MLWFASLMSVSSWCGEVFSAGTLATHEVLLNPDELAFRTGKGIEFMCPVKE